MPGEVLMLRIMILTHTESMKTHLQDFLDLRKKDTKEVAQSRGTCGDFLPPISS